MKLKTKLLCLYIIPLVIILLVLVSAGTISVRSIIFHDVEKGMKAAAISIAVAIDSSSNTEATMKKLVESYNEYQIIVTDKMGDILAVSDDSLKDGSLDIDYMGNYLFAHKMKVNNDECSVLRYPSKNLTIIVLMPFSEATASATKIVLNMFIAVFICMLVCLVVEVILLNSITRCLHIVVDTLDKIAEGDLQFKVEKRVQHRKDEIGKIMRAVLNLRGQMREVIGAIIEQGESVVTAAEQISDEASQTTNAIGQIDTAVLEISDGATSQATETQNATDNVKVIGDMIEETKYEVDNLDEQTSMMLNAGLEATDILVKLKEINGKTKGAIDVIFAQTNTTNESALRIQEATDMIANIAEETNLLSLNASIEAARAGEQGRGFAVVANQIQKLAEQSDESARVIAEIVTNLLSDSEKAVTSMNEVKAIIDEQDMMVENTDKAFDKVRVGIEETRNSVKSIERKAEKLDEARGNVIDIVSSLTAIAQENAASTQQTSASVTEVTAIVSDISDNTEIMKHCANSLMEKTSVFTL